MPEIKNRCYLIHAVAPRGTNIEKANTAFNDYVGDTRRGLVVWHDHFVGASGGVAIFDVRSDEEAAMLDDSGPLGGWTIDVRPLDFSGSAVKFLGQIDFTLDRYGGTSMAELTGEKEPN